MLSNELRKSLILVLPNPQGYMTEIEQDIPVDCMIAITFLKNDIPKHRDQIKPFYIEGKPANKNVPCILIDCGSVVNFMPFNTLYKLGYMPGQLSLCTLKIYDFDEFDKKTLGSIYIDLSIGGLDALIKFYVIDATTSYKMHLGRPWFHENGVIPDPLPKRWDGHES